MYILIIKQNKTKQNEEYYVFCARNERSLLSNVLLKKHLFWEQTGCRASPSMPHGSAGHWTFCWCHKLVEPLRWLWKLIVKWICPLWWLAQLRKHFCTLHKVQLRYTQTYTHVHTYTYTQLCNLHTPFVFLHRFRCAMWISFFFLVFFFSYKLESTRISNVGSGEQLTSESDCRISRMMPVWCLWDKPNLLFFHSVSLLPLGFSM